MPPSPPQAHIAKSFNISHPKPPAPTTNILEDSSALLLPLPLQFFEASNSPTGKEPVSFPNGLLRVSSVDKFPRCLRESGLLRRRVEPSMEEDVVIAVGASSSQVIVVVISDASRLILLVLLLMMTLLPLGLPLLLLPLVGLVVIREGWWSNRANNEVLLRLPLPINE